MNLDRKVLWACAAVAVIAVLFVFLVRQQAHQDQLESKFRTWGESDFMPGLVACTHPDDFWIGIRCADIIEAYQLRHAATSPAVTTP